MTVQVYGGPLLRTWFDRDLTLAGKVIVNVEGKLVPKLWYHDGVLMRIPNLAIHLAGGDFNPDKELELKPIIGMTVVNNLMKDDKGNADKHPSALMNAIAKDLKVKVADIHDFELNLVDTQPGVLGGIYNEYVFAGR